MQDIEKNRVEYVAQLEEQLRHMKRQLDEAKPLADKWTPELASENTGDALRITLSFGGKRVTTSVATSTLLNTDITTLTSSVVESMVQNLVFNQLTPMVRPIIEEAQRNVRLIENAGRW